MGAGRRHKTPKREAKDFTTRGSASGCPSGSHGSSGAPVPTGQWPGDDAVQAVGLNHSGGSLNCGNPKLVSSNPAWPVSQREALLYWTVNKSALRPEEETLSSKAGHYILKNIVQNKAASASAHKMYRCQTAMENCFPTMTHLLWVKLPITVTSYSSLSATQAAPYNSISTSPVCSVWIDYKLHRKRNTLLFSQVSRVPWTMSRTKQAFTVHLLNQWVNAWHHNIHAVLWCASLSNTVNVFQGQSSATTHLVNSSVTYLFTYVTVSH